MTEQTPESFDIEAWLSGTTRLARSVDVYGKAGLQDEIDALNKKLSDPAIHATPGEAKNVARQIEDLRAEMEASRVTFRLQALAQADRDAVNKAMGDREDDDERGLRLIAAMCVEPAGVTWEHLRALRDGGQGFAGIGTDYFEATITTTAMQVRAGRDVSVPFSLNASHILATLD